LFSVLYGLWDANNVAFNGDVLRELAAQFLDLAEKQGATAPLTIGHRIMGTTLATTGDFAGAVAHYDQSFALYDPAEHRSLAARFGHDNRVTVLRYRAFASWMLGYPEKAVSDIDYALKDAREIGQAATLMAAHELSASYILIFGGNYATANALLIPRPLSGRLPNLQFDGQDLIPLDELALAQTMQQCLTAPRADVISWRAHGR
jgi:hypothetical protein